jgi:hypothetical protein
MRDTTAGVRQQAVVAIVSGNAKGAPRRLLLLIRGRHEGEDKPRLAAGWLAGRLQTFVLLPLLPLLLLLRRRRRRAGGGSGGP